MQESALGTRRRLRQLVESYPGLHLRELAREAGLSEALAGYHLDAMEADGLVESQTEGIYRRFYPTETSRPSDEDRDMMGRLRQRVPLQIAIYILENGPSTHKELMRSLGIAKSTMSYHLRRLEGEGFLSTDPDSRQVRLDEPERVRRLLLAWTPPESLTDRFEKLWGAFYRRRKR